LPQSARAMLQAPPPAPPSITVACGGCGTAYRVPVAAAGKRLRCKRCQNIIAIPAPPPTP
jgi:hypothetical protein